MTIKDLKKYGYEFLKNFSDTALLDVELIMNKVLNLSKVEMILKEDEDVNNENFIKISELLQKRRENYPIAYITNEKEFRGLNFYVDESVLIPRPDTEILCEVIEKCLINEENMNKRDKLSYNNNYKQNSSFLNDNNFQLKNINSSEIQPFLLSEKFNLVDSDYKRLLEIGVGSGAISICLLNAFKEIFIDGIDISIGALQVSNLNAKNHNVLERFNLINADIFDKNVNNKLKKYDIIFSNPPYIKNSEKKELMKDVLFEPNIALFGGDTGLIFYEKITELSKDLLINQKKLVFEIGYNQAEEVFNIMKKNGFKDIKIYKDYANLDRVIIGSLN